MTQYKSVFSTAYLPPIQYFHHLIHCDEILIEAHETYQKQTYRNRSLIYSANGLLPLIIPVVKPYGNRTKIKDIRIDNSVKWQKEHWRSLVSAYRSSAYFEFITDSIIGFYEKSPDFIWDYNMGLLKAILCILDIDIKIVETHCFKKEYPNQTADFRNLISPKSSEFSKQFEQNAKPYHQVFKHKWGFEPNLSIIDLISNCGMESITILR